MVALSTSNLTLYDWVKMRDPDWDIADIANILEQQNEMLADVVYKEANGPTFHQCTVTTKLAEAYWRGINQGIPDSKSTTAQVTEGIAMLESRGEIDKKLADKMGDSGALRQSQMVHRMESMSQTMQSTLIYGNTAANPKQIMGFAPRYSSLSGPNAQNIIDAGGAASDNTSVWFVGWGDNTVHCVFPKGSSAGLQHEDRGVQDVYVHDGAGANTGKMLAYVDHYSWENGLVVEDWRYVVRIANVKVADLQGLSGTQASSASATNLIHMMSLSLDKVYNLNNCKGAFYCNRTAYAALRRQAMDKSQNAVTIESGNSQFGTARQWVSVYGFPVRKVDALVNNEARVV